MVLSSISYAIAEAVSVSKVNTIQEEIVSIENVTLDYMNSSNAAIEKMDKRLMLLEHFSQLLEFSDQNGQEAENLEKFLMPRLSNEKDHHPQLDFDFQESLISQVLIGNKNLKPNELMYKVFKLKETTSYISWLENLEGNSMCKHSSIVTMMIALSLEPDNKLYTRHDDTGALVSNSSESLMYYTNQFKISNLEMKYKSNGNSVDRANRKMVTDAETRLVFLEGHNPISDRISILFLNKTLEKEAQIQCSNSTTDKHSFKTGSTIDLPLYCSVLSSWWNATGIAFYSDGEEEVGMRTFSLNWKPTNIRFNSSSIAKMKDAVINLVKLRDEAINNGTKLSTQDLFDAMQNLATGAEHFLSFSTTFMEHISENKTAVGAAGMSSFTAVLIIIRGIYNSCMYRRRKSNKSSPEEGSRDSTECPGLISEEATQINYLISSDLSSEQPTLGDHLSEQTTQQAESTQSESESEGSNILDNNDQSPAAVEGPGLNAMSWGGPPGFVVGKKTNPLRSVFK